MPFASPHQDQRVAAFGPALPDATSAMILVHGRGATAESILDLARHLPVEGMTYLAPQAAGHTWYPYSFLAPIAQNEPGRSSGLETIGLLVEQLVAAGIPADKVVLAGFSQGACLASEFAARNPRRYGGLLAFSGGLIGPPGMAFELSGDLAGTPAFLGCSDVDPHIPLHRVEETAKELTALGAVVTKRIYPDMPHTIVHEEIAEARTLLAAL
ncbi:MAG: dienelactone hydrolase family protein [Bacteroidetes bacterium]|nr:dienelactone hydrolase family protein [Bacteroidota bacterium]MDA0873634.1 dienelactone hydrolase family protein [Bacteroidota bacterium]